MEKKRNISNETIKRMIVYLRYLDMLKKKGVKVFSSTDITSLLNIQPSQFLKDLSFFGVFGKRGVGYNVDDLYKAIRIILGVNKEKEVALVGVGKLGSALMQYSGFLKINVTIVACFDKNPNKVGTIIEGKKIYDINDANKVIKKLGIKIALLCVPVEEAQKTAEHIVSLGIKGILNFAPTTLVLPNYVYVSNVDMASELGNIIYYLQ